MRLLSSNRILTVLAGVMLAAGAAGYVPAAQAAPSKAHLIDTASSKHHYGSRGHDRHDGHQAHRGKSRYSQGASGHKSRYHGDHHGSHHKHHGKHYYSHDPHRYKGGRHDHRHGSHHRHRGRHDCRYGYYPFEEFFDRLLGYERHDGRHGPAHHR